MFQELVESLRQSLGSDAVHDDAPARQYHSADALNPVRAPHAPSSSWGIPTVVVTPTTTEQVASAVKLACRYKTPIVPYGGGTGLMGAAVAGEGAIVVDLKGMNRVRSISAEDRVAWTESGVVLKDLDEELGEHGLMLGHDPYSVPIATVGGAISTNSVGYRAAKYGSMGAQVLALEVVMPTGDVLTTKAVPKGASGPNLNSLFIGAEGTMGIITAAALRVFRVPEERRFATISFGSFEDGVRALSEMFAIGLRPAITDLTEEPQRQEPQMRVVMCLVFEGYREEVAAQEQRAKSICREAGGVDVGPAEAQRYWRERHRSAEWYKQDVLPLSPPEKWQAGWGSRGQWEYPHTALPISKVLEFRRRATEMAAEKGIAVREYAIWTEPELFSMILAGIEVDGRQTTQETFTETVDGILRLAQDMGGTMEYCHGIGLKLAHLVGREWGSGLEVARQIKKALDPYCIMNPGKLGL